MRFKQIAAAQYEHEIESYYTGKVIKVLSYTIHALDEDGRAWYHHDYDSSWHPMPGHPEEEE